MTKLEAFALAAIAASGWLMVALGPCHPKLPPPSTVPAAVPVTTLTDGCEIVRSHVTFDGKRLEVRVCEEREQ